jgi:PEP-CTERM motif-containing protein
MKPRTLALALITATLLVGASRVQATVLFHWKCDSVPSGPTGCVTYGLGLTLGFKDSVIGSSQSTFTGANAMLDSLSFTSTIGNGFTTTLANFTSSENANFQVVFDSTKQNVLRLNDATSDVLLWVDFSPAPGAIRFNEGSGQLTTPGDFTYFIDRVQDWSPFAYSTPGQQIHGHFERVPTPPNPIPEPETYAMLLAGLGLFGLVGRRRTQTAA